MTLPVPDNDFGERVRGHLRDDHVVWLTTTGDDDTPQPNPVWFHWAGDDSVLVYNANQARRLEHVAVRPRVSLHFNCTPQGGDVVVLAGVAEQALDAPSPDHHEAYLDKYREGIAALGDDPESFARSYSVPLRIRITRVRGF